MRSTFLLVVLIAAGATSSLSAALTTVDDPNFGRSVVGDSETGLEWLNPKALEYEMWESYPFEPQRMSFDHVSKIVGTGKLAEYRYATRSEVMTFFDHLGLPVDNYPNLSTADGDLFSAATVFIGITFQYPYGDTTTRGIVSDPTPGGPGLFYASTYVSERLREGADAFFYIETITYTDFHEPVGGSANVDGHWLVRDTNAIPEPSTLALAGIGTIALLAYRTRRLLGPRL